MSAKEPRWVLAADIDNTLTGDAAALQALSRQLEALRQTGQLFLILSTGRRLVQVLEGFDMESLPQADAIISQVGTEIYLPPYAETMSPLAEWESRLQSTYSRDRALSFLEGIEGVEMQPAHYNTALKVSAFLHRAPDPHAAAHAIRRRIEEAGETDVYQVVWSSGRHLDIIPADAGKGKAILFLLEYLQLEPQQVIVAGDSGNDRAMFDTFPHGIVVANAQPELKALAQEERPGCYFASQPAAAGVAEGLRHFGVLQ